MKIASLTLVTLPLLASPGWTRPQEALPQPKPAYQLEKFHVMLGHFEGGGQYVPTAGAEPLRWTAVAKGTLVLGGHVVQFDEAIQVDGGAVHFRTLYGWDRDRRRPVSYTVGSMGAGTSDVSWVDGTLVATAQGSEGGQLFADRSLLRFDDTGYTFHMDRYEGLSKGYEKVSGTMKRASREPETPAAPQPVPGQELAKLTPIIGKWSLEGEVNMMGSEMDITGVEINRWLYGGAVIGGRIVGQPGDFESHSYLAYDPEDRVYRHVHATSMGELGMATGQIEGDQVVFTQMSQQFGQPSVQRTVIQIEEGALSHVWTHTITGVAEPLLSFTAVYRSFEGDAPVRPPNP